MTVYSGGGRQPTAATPIDLRRCCCWPRRTKKGANKRIFKKKRADWRGKKQNVFTTIQSKAGSQSNKKKRGRGERFTKKMLGDSFKSSSRGAHTQKKKKKGKTLHSFQSGKLLLCSLYYGGRNSRHKSCCRPRQKTCLNYKVTRKNNPKEMTPPGSLSLSLLLNVTYIVGLCYTPGSSAVRSSSLFGKKKKKTISNWFSP